ncbi:MAG: Fe-S cluster assembly sulfur transfer protein SufU [Rubrobacter sp.]
MRELYKEILLDHFRRPRNRRELSDADIHEHLDNPLCGDEVTVYARLRNGALAELGFTGRGCSISQASASMLTEHLEGKSREEAGEEIEAFLEMMRTEENEELGELAALKGIIQTPNRIRCATLAWVALKRGLAGPQTVPSTPKPVSSLARRATRDDPKPPDARDDAP